jgi:hypothetical protein
MGSVREHRHGLDLSQDAAIVLALARTAICFARSRTEEAERWLRVLRMHGRVGGALQALGVGEEPLEPPTDSRDAERRPLNRAELEATIQRVSDRAEDFARRTGASTVGTVHVLFGVLAIYGQAFDRELYRRGASRDELFERLAGAPVMGADRN